MLNKDLIKISELSKEAISYLQNEENYNHHTPTEDNIYVWKTIFSQIIKNINENKGIHPDYVYGFNRLDLRENLPPTLAELNTKLYGIGWQAIFVKGLVPNLLYAELQKNCIFPIAADIRKKRDLEHSAAPDFIHDIVGHLPMMFSAPYQKLVVSWASLVIENPPTKGDMASNKALYDLINEKEKMDLCERTIQEKTEILKKAYIDNLKLPPSKYAMLERFYTWAVEFGIIKNNETMNIIGGAALSSTSEMKAIMSGKTALRHFTDNAINTPVDYTLVQDFLFYVHNFDDYFAELKKIESHEK